MSGHDSKYFTTTKKGEIHELKEELNSQYKDSQDPNPLIRALAVRTMGCIRVDKITEYLCDPLQRCLKVFILDSLAKYKASDVRDAESIVERVTPRLQHANCAVVLSAVKVILQQMELITSIDIIRTLTKKMAPPLVTLLSSEPEIQYVALRNINLIVQRRPGVLAHEIKVFFCKYNDPIYVKLEKLEIMIKLASDRNIDQVLLEFKEYATEVDVDFVRKAVRAIGRCAIKLERATERCINVLLDLIKLKVNYVVQEAIIVIKDIFRRYPNTYESIIATLCESLDTLDEPEAKASMIWIIGEYAERIDNADELLESFLEGFPEETAQVQLQLLTAAVKLFLKKPTEGPQQMIQVVLNNATQETDNPDLRDRAFVYWRLLSTDPEAAKDVVLAEKPIISDEINDFEPSLLDLLLANIATLASVYHKPPEAFVSRVPATAQTTNADAEADDLYNDGQLGISGTEDSSAPVPASSLDGVGTRSVAASAAPVAPTKTLPPLQQAPQAAGPDLLGDLVGLDSNGTVPGNAPPAAEVALPVLLAASAAQGLQISGTLTRQNGAVFYNLRFDNGSPVPLDGFMIQFNKNTFGIAPAAPLQVPLLQPGGSASVLLPLALFQNLSPPPPTSVLQVAIKNNQQPVWYFTDSVPLHVFFSEEGRVERAAFLETWKSLPDANEVTRELPESIISNLDVTLERLASKNVFFVAKRRLKDTNKDAIYTSVKLVSNVALLVEFTFASGIPGVTCAVKTPSVEYTPLFFESVEKLLQ
eukprot:SM000127S26646  [mRNA]  locus=s127:194449:199597:+ [translate_table: standard]